jgi:hypothetical protein
MQMENDMSSLDIFYPYNEKLPKCTAHDVYIYRNCFYLSKHGCNVNLMTGRPKLSASDLHKHYLGKGSQGAFPPSTYKFKQTHTLDGSFHHYSLPLIRKTTPLKISWNLPFFVFCQYWLKTYKPEFVIMSVLKQAHYHLKRRVQGVRYVYELHDLSIYPPLRTNQYQPTSLPIEEYRLTKPLKKRFEMEREVLNHTDLITVTTSTLKSILQNPPYKIMRPIEVVPLGSSFTPMKPKTISSKYIRLGYVGQLYKTQGLIQLMHALKQAKHCILDVFGGTYPQVQKFKSLSEKLNISSQVNFHGFKAPAQLQQELQAIDLLVAPFELTPHMCYVAHTKLIDYNRLTRPIIAPNIPEVREQLSQIAPSCFLFSPEGYPNKIDSLAKVLDNLKNTKQISTCMVRQFKELEQFPERFSWDERTAHLTQILQNRFSFPTTP